jgi:hypothetical protein
MSALKRGIAPFSALFGRVNSRLDAGIPCLLLNAGAVDASCLPRALDFETSQMKGRSIPWIHRRGFNYSSRSNGLDSEPMGRGYRLARGFSAQRLPTPRRPPPLQTMDARRGFRLSPRTNHPDRTSSTLPLTTLVTPASTSTTNLSPSVQAKMALEPEFIPLPTDPEAYQIWLGEWKSLRKKESKLTLQREMHGGVSSGMSGTLRVVAIAMAANFAMFLLKAWAAYHSGSSTMVSEALHSLADSLNQCLLLYGIYRSMQKPDPEHPYGFQSERYAWALVSGVGIFFLGGGVSIQHGIHGLLHPEPLGSLGTAVGVLIANFAVDGYSMKTAWVELKEKAEEQGVGPWEYLRKGSDPTTSAVFYEDMAALSGEQERALASSSEGLIGFVSVRLC